MSATATLNPPADSKVEREYFVSWQSKVSAAHGCDDRMLTYDEAIELAEDLNAKQPQWHHFVAKRLKPKNGKAAKSDLPQGTYLPSKKAKAGARLIRATGIAFSVIIESDDDLTM